MYANSQRTIYCKVHDDVSLFSAQLPGYRLRNVLTFLHRVYITCFNELTVISGGGLGMVVEVEVLKFVSLIPLIAFKVTEVRTSSAVLVLVLDEASVLSQNIMFS